MRKLMLELEMSTKSSMSTLRVVLAEGLMEILFDRYTELSC